MAQINETPPDLPVTVSEPVRNLVYACIAKNPADRPQSAAHLARAATALRRGDVQAAAAAVPAVLGAAGGHRRDHADAAAGSDPPPPPSSRRRAPVAIDAEAEEEAEEKKRSPWTWPLIVLIAILAIVLIGTIIALALNQGNDKPAPATTTARRPRRAPRRRPPGPAAHERGARDDPGRPRRLHRPERRRGAARSRRSACPSSTRRVRAAHRRPTREHGLRRQPERPGAPGTTITVTYLSARSRRAHPSPAPTGARTRQGRARPHVTVSWPAATCPAGQTLSGYEVAVTGDATPPTARSSAGHHHRAT